MICRDTGPAGRGGSVGKRPLDMLGLEGRAGVAAAAGSVCDSQAESVFLYTSIPDRA